MERQIPCYGCRMSALDRTQVRLHKSLADAEDYGYMPGTPEERIGEVWALTREVWTLLQESHAEQRLRRDVAVLIRGER